MKQTLDFQLHEVAGYINWLYFFHAWGFPARLGDITRQCSCVACRTAWIDSLLPSDRAKAQEAIQLYDDAQRLLRELDGCFQTHAKIALFPAYSKSDDIIVATDDGQNVHIPLLRQQKTDADGVCWCLSDFISPIAPKNVEILQPLDQTPWLKKRGDSRWNVENTVGIFVATVDEAMEKQHEEDNYLHLLHQTLADRLAEATAEHVHELVRKELWGYAPNEQLTIAQLFSEKYQGKRPAVGYPSLPDQSLNFVLDELLDFSSVGVSLTKAGAMMPHASTSGLMLAHPATKHFCVGTIGADQRADYARRRGMSVEEISRFI